MKIFEKPSAKGSSIRFNSLMVPTRWPVVYGFVLLSLIDRAGFASDDPSVDSTCLDKLRMVQTPTWLKPAKPPKSKHLFDVRCLGGGRWDDRHGEPNIPHTASFSGRVLDGRDRPVPGIIIKEWEGLFSAETDKDGMWHASPKLTSGPATPDCLHVDHVIIYDGHCPGGRVRFAPLFAEIDIEQSEGKPGQHVWHGEHHLVEARDIAVKQHVCGKLRDNSSDYDVANAALRFSGATGSVDKFGEFHLIGSAGPCPYRGTLHVNAAGFNPVVMKFSLVPVGETVVSSNLENVTVPRIGYHVEP